MGNKDVCFKFGNEKYDPEEVDNFVVELGCVGFRDPPITLKEPRFGEPVLSPFYVNMRNVSSPVKNLANTACYLAWFCKENKIYGDYFLGVPAGATKLGIVTTFIYCDQDSKVPQSREKPKDHGEPKDRYYVTAVEKGDEPIIVEDVNTTGAGLIKEVEKAIEAGAKPLAVTLVNRLEKRDDGRAIKDVMNEMGVRYWCMSDTKRLLPLEFQKLTPERQDFFGPKVEAYYEKYGAVKLTANDLKRKVA